jgi:hypothetical protein
MHVHPVHPPWVRYWYRYSNKTSVADPGIFILDLDPYFYLSQISDPASKNREKREGEKRLLYYLFCSLKYHKIETYFIFELVKKLFGQFAKNYRTIYPKSCH